MAITLHAKPSPLLVGMGGDEFTAGIQHVAVVGTQKLWAVLCS